MSEKAIWDVLNRSLFFIKNAVKKSEAKTEDKIDVYDPDSRQLLLECREPDIGGLTKITRFIGGRHDVGAPFNLVAAVPGSAEQALRITGGSATLSFGGPAVSISDYWNSLLGKLKKKNLSFGMKFIFLPERQGKPFVLHIKGSEILFGERAVGRISKWNSDFYRESKFDYAFSISEEVPPNSLLRQVLLAFALAKKRIVV